MTYIYRNTLITILFFFFSSRIINDLQIAGNTSDDMGWKSKLKLPPKDNRFKTTVSLPTNQSEFIQFKAQTN